jgi:hypothetical protein
MLVNLDREDLVKLVKTVSPTTYNDLDHIYFKGKGNLGPGDNWTWKKEVLENMDEDMLWTVYKYCKGEK